MVTCERCEFWSTEKKHCIDPISWMDGEAKEEVCRYRENATQRPQRSGGQAERVVMSRLITRIYNSGYMAGHNDTVEACFTDIYQQDIDTYQEDVVEELLNELQDS